MAILLRASCCLLVNWVIQETKTYSGVSNELEAFFFLSATSFV